MTIVIDHLMWGAPSLEAGIAEAASLFGTAPAPGGVHPGLGTCNALLSLGESVYLEVIAPDPEQDLSGNFGGRLAQLSAPSLITWAAGAPGLADVAERAAGLELVARGPVPTERSAPDGSLLAWELLFLGGHAYGSLVPFFIDWLQTPHPATTNPAGGRFRQLEITATDAAGLNAIFAGLGMAQRAEQGDLSALAAVIETESGVVRLESTPEAAALSL
ncbi:MAG: VOC family protein [Pseudomonadota bacterium]